jgi:hypothetical protein
MGLQVQWNATLLIVVRFLTCRLYEEHDQELAVESALAHHHRLAARHRSPPWNFDLPGTCGSTGSLGNVPNSLNPPSTIKLISVIAFRYSSIMQCAGTDR